MTGAMAHEAVPPVQGAAARNASVNVPKPLLFRQVKVFDGKSGRISDPRDVLVRGNRIERISAQAISEPEARVIDGQGRVLMPGLIDMHWHTMFVGTPGQGTMENDLSYLAIMGAREATRTLMRGFTTVRDAGGASFGLKNAIDGGVLPGPRIHPSGAMITVTSGHGDFRDPHQLPRRIGEPGSFHDTTGNMVIADSADEVRLRVREQLMQGASQIKLTAGGGVSSPHSPLDVVTFTPAEVRAAVEAATNWGTYVMVHAYTPDAIRQSIEAGVKVIEHGSLMDEDTAKLMASRGVWLSAQAFPEQMRQAFPPGSVQREKFEDVLAGSARAFQLARKHKIKTAFGTDILFSSDLAGLQGSILASLTQWYSPAEALVMATGTNGELLQLAGKRNPYPGEIGVVREGALADLLLVDGDPVADISVVARPHDCFVVIVKDGTIYKDALSEGRAGTCRRN